MRLLRSVTNSWLSCWEDSPVYCKAKDDSSHAPIPQETCSTLLGVKTSQSPKKAPFGRPLGPRSVSARSRSSHGSTAPPRTLHLCQKHNKSDIAKHRNSEIRAASVSILWILVIDSLYQGATTSGDREAKRIEEPKRQPEASWGQRLAKRRGAWKNKSNPRVPRISRIS